MKKIQFFALGAFVLMGTLVSCKGTGNTSQTEMTTQIDSISYVIGSQLSQGLAPFLVRSGVLKDTAEIVKSMATETDATKKAVLKTRLDSLVKVNAAAQEEFFRGLKLALDQKDIESPYAKGVAIGAQILGQMLPQMKNQVLGEGSSEKLNMSVLVKGFQESYNNQKSPIKDGQAWLQSISAKKQAENAAKKQAEIEKKYAPEKAAAEKFMLDNKSQAGIVTTASGLQYKIDKKGTGPQVKETDNVVINYKGMFVNGTVFDQSKEPVTMSPAQVVPGFKEALTLMTVGSKWTVYLPYALAYGISGNQGIPPYSDLIFELEVVKLAPSAKVQAPQAPQVRH